MAKRMSDDEIMDYTYNKLFGDLDGIQSSEMFKDGSEGEGAAQKVTPGAGEAGMAGIDISIKPIMQGAAESGRNPEGGEPESENEDDHLKGISKMSPLMAQLHGSR